MIQENTCTSRSTHTYAMVTTAFMAAVTCILAPCLLYTSDAADE